MPSLRVRTLSTCLLSFAATIAAAQSASPQLRTSQEWYDIGAGEVARNAKLKNKTGRAKNVILFVGDGMGISTVTAARILDGQRRKVDGESNRLSFETFDNLALSITASANQQTSDSAPTATAMVTGAKANDYAISVATSVDRDEADAAVLAKHSLRTILEQAEERGMSTGIVTTARVTHATPATNYAHVGNRDWEVDANLPSNATAKDIARQLIEFNVGDGIEVVMGGGRSNFLPQTASDPEYPQRTGARADGRDLTKEWQSRWPNSAYIWNRKQFDQLDVSKTKHVLGLFERSHMRYEADRPNDAAGEPSLAEMTSKALQLLRTNNKGFYLMVEAGRIDHGHHAGNAYRALTDTIALSEAVKVARELTNERDTLIIVTADHSHTMTIAGYPSRGNPILGKAAINGVELKDALGLPYTTLSYANGPGWIGNEQRREFDASKEQAAAAEYAGTAPRPNLNEVDTEDPAYLQEATVPLGSETHGGEDVAIYAQGPNSHLVRGLLEQNAIYHVMRSALGWK